MYSYNCYIHIINVTTSRLDFQSRLCRKKLSKFSQHPDWRNASNYVAKRYMKEAGRQVYFQDVKLQMDAKLWGEEYNKHKPPKKVSV